MYDKVKLWMERTRATPDVSVFLEKAKEQADLDTGEVCVYGSLDGLKVSVYTGGISIVGSLPKFLYKSNVYPLDRHRDTFDDFAMQKILNAYHGDIKTIEMTLKPLYASRSGFDKRMTKIRQTWEKMLNSTSGGINYVNSVRNLLV